MGVIGLTKEQWESIEAKQGGFPLVPQGKGLLFEITGYREGTYENKKGETVEYVSVTCTHHNEEGQAFDHGEFFNLTDVGYPFLKGFLESIGRVDLFEEDAEWEMLNGTAFTADVRHRVDKNSKEVRANIVTQTIAAISHDEGEEIEGWRRDVGLDHGDDEEEMPKKPIKKKTRKAVKADFDLKDDEDDEDDEDDKPAPKKSRRRSRRGTQED